MRQPKGTLHREKRGFTAIEIAMVVTVIAILALLILPLFRDRVEAARRTAAQDELRSIVTAELLVFADTGDFFRLQDLDNSMAFNDPPIRPDEEIPIARWNRPFTPEERAKLLPGGAVQWKGPYVAINKFKYLELQDALNGFGQFFWSWSGRGGPIMNILTPAVGTTPAGTDWWPATDVPIAANSPLGDSGDQRTDRILIDPWGTPYLFFGTGRLLEEGGAYFTSESDFGNAAVFCLGADGMPGSILGPIAGPELTRELGILGTGDDYAFYM